MNLLITTFDGDDTETLVTFNMGKSVPTKFWSGEHELAKAWSRFKVRDRTSFNKVAAKWFPKFVEIESPTQDLRLLINGFIDAGHQVCVAEIDDDNRISIHGAGRENEKGEAINADGVLMSECDINGVAYPKPPEGQHRYRITVIYSGASYCDYHKMWFGATPKDAAKFCLDNMPTNPLFDSSVEHILQTIVADVDTNETCFFNGPDLSETVETKMLATLFGRAARQDEDETTDLDALLSGLGGMFR